MADPCIMECRLCAKDVNEWEMTQILPCLHMFCNECMDKHKRVSKLCPALHCYSLLNPNPEFKWNPCENGLCPKRFSTPLDLQKLPICEHWICSECHDSMAQKKTPMCPVSKCNTAVPGLESTGKEGSDGGQPSKASQKQHPTMPRCNSNDECEHDALPNFPSEHDCEHEVCLQCLDHMIVDCERADFMPHCPNAQCLRPYSLDSVAALRALLPERAKYFERLELDKNYGYDAIKDDSIMVLDITPEYNQPQPLVNVKCSVDGDGHTEVVKYVVNGSLVGLLRELRRALKIVPTDKIYGYYLRRQDHNEDIPDEELVTSPNGAQRPISEFRIKSGDTIIVDTTGIVKQKTKGRGGQ